MDISYLGSTTVYSGSTDELRFVTVPFTVTTYHTLVAFVICRDTGLSPTIPSEWSQVMSIEGTSGSTYVFVHQPKEDVINPTYSIQGLSNKLNLGFISLFSGVTYHISKMINAFNGIDNYGDTGNTGFTTTIDNTSIIHSVGFFKMQSTSNWSSNPSLIWTETEDYSKTHESYILSLSSAISSGVAADKYTFNYDISVAEGEENISMVLALTPRRSNALMSMSSF